MRLPGTSQTPTTVPEFTQQDQSHAVFEAVFFMTWSYHCKNRHTFSPLAGRCVKNNCEEQFGWYHLSWIAVRCCNLDRRRMPACCSCASRLQALSQIMPSRKIGFRYKGLRDLGFRRSWGEAVGCFFGSLGGFKRFKRCLCFPLGAGGGLANTQTMTSPTPRGLVGACRICELDVEDARHDDVKGPTSEGA